MSAYPFPWYTSIWWVLLVFFVALILFHTALVWVGKLNSIQWKKVDYIWVSFALTGVLASVEQTRSLVARNEAASAEHRIEASFKWVLSSADFGTSPAICRTFVRSEYSPPQDAFIRTQQEFDRQCEWFKGLTSKLREVGPKSSESINLVDLAKERPAGGDSWAYVQLDESVANYNGALSELKKLRADAEMSSLQEIVQVLGPSLLALAIALRLTKVSGELSLERRRSSAGA